jgi:hypothetical protein
MTKRLSQRVVLSSVIYGAMHQRLDDEKLTRQLAFNQAVMQLVNVVDTSKALEFISAPRLGREIVITLPTELANSVRLLSKKLKVSIKDFLHTAVLLWLQFDDHHIADMEIRTELPLSFPHYRFYDDRRCAAAIPSDLLKWMRKRQDNYNHTKSNRPEKLLLKHIHIDSVAHLLSELHHGNKIQTYAIPIEHCITTTFHYSILHDKLLRSIAKLHRIPVRRLIIAAIINYAMKHGFKPSRKWAKPSTAYHLYLTPRSAIIT